MNQPETLSRANLSFHRTMALGSVIMLLVSIAGCRLTAINSDVAAYVIALLLAVAMLSPLPVYWHHKQKFILRDSALTIPWAMALALLLPFPVIIAARLGIPLRDSLFAHFDQSIGVSVPAIQSWAHRHWLGAVINWSYPVGITLLPAAALVPALTGKLSEAREFLLANLAAFFFGIPLFALFPAVGPWYYYHFSPNPAQIYTQSQVFLLRSPGPYFFASQAIGVVCFPSFHVVWAILCAAAFWGYRSLRIPLAILSGMIIISTLTTGWHYCSDVLAGIVVACTSLALARVCTHSLRDAISPSQSAQSAQVVEVTL